jgi:hypothetical protein
MIENVIPKILRIDRSRCRSRRWCYSQTLVLKALQIEVRATRDKIDVSGVLLGHSPTGSEKEMNVYQL